MTPQQIQDAAEHCRRQLIDDTLRFWLQHGIDREQGGFLTAVNRDGSVIDTDKGMWQQGRFTWLLGKLYNHLENNPQWLELCRHGIEFIDTWGFDPGDQRMWFLVNRRGQPLRKRRYAFTEAFAAIAYGEFARATGEEWAARRAEQLMHAFIQQHQHGVDPSPKYTDTRPTRSFGYPMILLNVAQELRESIGLPGADAWIDQCVDQITSWFCKPELKAVMETVGPEGEIIDHFDGRLLNPGHAIEGAWFILREAEYRSDARLLQLGCQMLQWMWNRGWDPEFGGLFYFVDLHHLPVQEYWHDMKFWWPHNETIIATLYAYKLTGREEYLRWHQQVSGWAEQRFPDHEFGEWYGYLHRDGRLSVPLKGNLWKGPFHLPRQQWVCYQLYQSMLT